MGKKYMGRVSQLIRRKLTQLFLEESQDIRLNEVTITDVTVNRDTTRAEVYYSLIGTEDDIAKMQVVLDGASGWLRAQMAATLRLRNIPKLVFVYDPSLEHGARIEVLLEQLHDEDDAEDDEFADAGTDNSLTEDC